MVISIWGALIFSSPVSYDKILSISYYEINKAYTEVQRSGMVTRSLIEITILTVHARSLWKGFIGSLLTSTTFMFKTLSAVYVYSHKDLQQCGGHSISYCPVDVSLEMGFLLHMYMRLQFLSSTYAVVLGVAARALIGIVIWSQQLDQ